MEARFILTGVCGLTTTSTSKPIRKSVKAIRKSSIKISKKKDVVKPRNSKYNVVSEDIRNKVIYHCNCGEKQ